MQIVLHEMSEPIFLEKIRRNKKIISLTSAELA